MRAWRVHEFGEPADVLLEFSASEKGTGVVIS